MKVAGFASLGAPGPLSPAQPGTTCGIPRPGRGDAAAVTAR